MLRKLRKTESLSDASENDLEVIELRPKEAGPRSGVKRSVNNPEETEEHPKLSNFFASAVACILEHCVDELGIIGNIGHLPKVEANLEYKTLEQAYGGNRYTSYIYDPETIEPYEVALSKQPVVKFQKDRSYIEKVLNEAITELTTCKTYSHFIKRLHEYDLTFAQETRLLLQADDNAIQLKQLKTHLEKEKIKALTEIQRTSESIGHLKDVYEDLIFENGIKARYIDNWENARLESNNYALDQVEEHYLNIINTYKTDIEREVRIDAEIESYITEVQQEYEDQIQVWMETYDKETEIRDMEIQVLKEKREEQFMRLEKLAKLFEEHKVEIEQYLIIKDKRKQEEEELERLNKEGTKIQAWWRGVMVRRNLGPYRKKGKKGDKKGKGKGKGKGKK